MVGACDALTTPRPLGPLYDIARAAGGDSTAVIASGAARHELFTAFLDALASPPRPVIAVIEDVQWADDATRDLLVYLLRRVADTRAVVVVTYRDDEVGSDHPLRSVLRHVTTVPAARRVVLERLSVPGIAELAAGHEVDPAHVYEVTAGDPFFFPAACHYEDGRFSEAAAEDECAEQHPDTGAEFTFWHPDLVPLHVWAWLHNPEGLYNPTKPLMSAYNGDSGGGASDGRSFPV